MKFTLGFSPCPNDTFLFDALVNGKIHAEGWEWDVVLADVEQLNEWAQIGKLDITKISVGAIPKAGHHYQVLDSGGAMGMGVGPLLITRPELKEVTPGNIPFTVALPGEHTTAHQLFSLAYPSHTQKKFMLFSSIEDAVLNGNADFGVIIHENRFTYAARGLCLVRDLGVFWEEQTGLPIPLGVIAIKRTLGKPVAKAMNRLIRESVDYAFRHSLSDLPEFIKIHAAEMNPDVMRKHIELYVNDFSRSMGAEGRSAIVQFLHSTRTSVAGSSVLPDDLFAD